LVCIFKNFLIFLKGSVCLARLVALRGGIGWRFVVMAGWASGERYVSLSIGSKRRDKGKREKGRKFLFPKEN
jgi:hypothetical protein